MQLLGLAALPLAYRLFKHLPGRGYAFSKPLGLLLTSYISWMGTSLGYLPNTEGGILVALALTIGLSVAVYVRHSEENTPSLRTLLSEHRRLILTAEALFAVGFLACAGLRAYAPDKIMSAGGEKFMEIAFLSAVLRSPTFPPHDPWLSGFAISYYYFGYVMMGLLTRLSAVLPGVGFELYDALMFALTLTGAFGVVYSLVAGDRVKEHGDESALRYGLLGSLLVAVMGNLEGLLEVLYARGLLPAAFWRWIDIPNLVQSAQETGSWLPGGGWWWWRASRVIRDRNLIGEPMPLNPIDEFPFFSFLLGDNHPHVMALPFVLLAIALALNLLRMQRRPDEDQTQRPAASWWNPAAYALDGDWGLLALYALGLGSLGFLNTWDFPIYVGLTVLAYAAGRHAIGDLPLIDVLQRAAVLGVALALLGALLYLPFYIGFSSQAGGIVPYVLPPTRLPQYLVMFGPFVFVVTWFLLARLVRARSRAKVWTRLARTWAALVAVPVAFLGIAAAAVAFTSVGRQAAQNLLSDPRVQQVVGSAGPAATARAILLARLRDPWLFLALSSMIAAAALSAFRSWNSRRGRDIDPSGPQFVSLLALCGLGLTFAVEFVYLRDSFGVRMNTVFKFYYQAWVMLGCASAYGIWWMLNEFYEQPHSTGRLAFGGIAVLLVAASLVYPPMAIYSRVDGFENTPVLNGAANVARDHPDDWAAIEWLRANASGTPVILEAPGRSYDYEGRISAFTGHQAVLGWAVHESQWRGDYVKQGKREPDIKTIYTTEDPRRALDLLRKWDVDYLVVGPAERVYVQRLCAEAERQCNPSSVLTTLQRTLKRVFEQGQTTVYRVPGA